MAVRVRLPQVMTKPGTAKMIIRVAIVCAAVIGIVVCAVGGYYYYRYGSIVDERLKQPLFATTAKIYAAPREVRPGQKLSMPAIVNELRQAGYTAEGTAKPSPLGTYTESGETVSVHPGPQS